MEILNILAMTILIIGLPTIITIAVIRNKHIPDNNETSNNHK